MSSYFEHCALGASSPAQAGDSATAGFAVITGCPAFAGHDSGEIGDFNLKHPALHPLIEAAIKARPL
jgi:hypothetical protein